MQKVRGFLKELIAWIRVRVRCRNIRVSDPILVYQMGKVGSLTIIETIKALELDNPVFHLHTLNKQVLANALKLRRDSVTPYLPEHLVASKCLSREMRKGVFSCKIITLTRDSVSRVISHVFEDWKEKAPDAKIGDSLDIGTMEHVINNLVSRRAGIIDPTIFFDSELKSNFGIDVFDVSFDSSKGYAIYENELVSVLLLRMEDIDRVLNDALVEFLGLEQKKITLVNANIGREKWYGEILEEVKNKISFPEDMIDKMLDTRYMNHFYFNDIADIRKKWVIRGGFED